MRVVIDTSVLVAGFRSASGAAFAILRAIDRGALTPLVSNALIYEYDEVLTRPEQIAAHGRSAAEIRAAVDALLVLSEPVDFRRRLRPLARDPNDDFVLETAIFGRADAIVTHNIRDVGEGARRFGIAVLRPADLMIRLSS